MSQSAQLIVIDLQQGFIKPSTEPVALATKELLEQNIFGSVIFTRFWNRLGSPHREILGWHKMDTDEECSLWSGVHHFASEVVDKTTYSAFNEELREKITRVKSPTVFLAGLDTECCVLKTAADLFEAGIRPVVLADYCASGGGEISHQAGLTALKRIIGEEQILTDAPDLSVLKSKIVSYLE